MTTWIILAIGAAGLIASLYLTIDEQRETAEELAIATALLREQTAKAEAAVTILTSEREAMNRMANRLKELEHKRDGLETTLNAERLTRETLEQENAEYKRWADSRLPDAAVRMLNDSPLYPGHPAGGVFQRESPDHPGGAPEPGRDNPQPAPDEPDRPVRRSPDNSERPDGSD